MTSTILIVIFLGLYLYFRVRRTISTASSSNQPSTTGVPHVDFDESVEQAQDAPEYFTYETLEPSEVVQPEYQRADVKTTHRRELTDVQPVEQAADSLQDFDLRQAVIAQTILENPYHSC